MNFDLWILGILTLLGALCLIFHCVLIVRVWAAREARWHHRGLVLVPPLAPAIAWMVKARAEVIIWGFLVALYLIIERSTH